MAASHLSANFDDLVRLVTAIAALGAAVLGAVNRRKIDKVKHEVNSTAARQTERVDQLGRALQDANIDIPPRPPNASSTQATPPEAGA